MDFFTTLPSELILRIFNFLPTSHPSPLLPVILTSKRLNDLITPLLYSHITLHTCDDPLGFHQPSLDSLTTPKNVERVKKYTKVATIRMKTDDDDDEYTITKKEIENMEMQMMLFWMKFAEEDVSIEEVYTDSLTITPSLPSYLRNRIKSTKACLSGRVQTSLDTARESELFTSLASLTITELDANFGNFARSWKFLQSVRSTLTHLKLAGDEAMLKYFIDSATTNDLPRMLERYTFTPEEGGGGRLENIRSLDLSYFLGLDDVISEFATQMVKVDAITKLRVAHCEMSNQFIRAVTSVMSNLTDLNLDIRNGGREVIHDILCGLPSECRLSSLAVRCKEDRSLSGLGLEDNKPGQGPLIKKECFERFKKTLKKLKIEYVLNLGELEEVVNETVEEIPVQCGVGDDGHLSLEVLAGYPVLEDLAIAIGNFEMKESAPKFPKLRSLYLLNNLNRGVETSFVKKCIEWLISNSNRSDHFLPLQVVLYKDTEDAFLRWCNLGAHAGLPVLNIESSEELGRTAKELALYYPHIDV
ncbi:hypothetical protein TWF694_004581 [Orbilia ellipsospora]|uniref:F-box domain-containing protein n=1 Tax=Orbilia ellipsospora TaxID=2528407 RepID=A0AAV9WWQ2_9PEZI